MLCNVVYNIIFILVAATKNILKSDGIGGLFVGLAPRLIRRTLMTALSWTLYERIFQYLASRSKES